MKYLVRWKDYCGNTHEKQYKTVDRAIKKVFAVYSWYKNGVCIRLADNEKILGREV